VRILITGGLGFIGSHTCIALIQAGYHPIVIDNLRNTRLTVKKAIEEITGKPLEFYELNVKDTEAITTQIGTIEGIIHFAALKSITESIDNPMGYYSENIESLLSAIEIAKVKKVKSFIFSSSATVYGKTNEICVSEKTPIGEPLNPYAHTKILGEKILNSGSWDFKTIILRYFNPIGAHDSRKIGELPIGEPNNLIPFITQTASGKRKQLTVYGDNYNTKDGTCIRDFIHVMDLAESHVAALEYSQKMNEAIDVFNVGTGKGNTVLEVIEAFEKVNNLKLNYSVGERRPGDIEAIYTDTSKIESKLGWKAQKELLTSMKDSWEWEKSLS